MSTRSFEIMFSDLNENAKKRYLEFQRVSDPSDLNDETCPIAIVESEEE